MPLIWIRMPGFSFEKGNYAEARIYIDNAMKSEGGDKSDVIVEHCGDIYYMTGDVDGALTYWKKALEMGSESKTLETENRKEKYIAANEKNRLFFVDCSRIGRL